MSSNHVILAFDSSGGACSVAVAEARRVLAERQETMERGQAERLAPLIESTLRSAGRSLAELDAVAVTTGPGSFTGLRIGIAMAKGIAQALGLPLIGVASFDAVARAARPGLAGPALCILLESRRAEVYLQLFAATGEPRSEPLALAPEELAPWLSARLSGAPVRLAGDAAARLADGLAGAGVAATLSGVGGPSARFVAEIAADRLAAGCLAAPVEPLYLRPPDVTQPRGS